jgi:hypothetical protein
MTCTQLSSTVIIALLSSISGQVFMVTSHLESDLNMKTYIKNEGSRHWVTGKRIFTDHWVHPEHCNGYPRIFFQRFLRSIYEDFHYNFL